MTTDALFALADASEKFTANRATSDQPRMLCEAINSDTDPIVKVTACDGVIVSVEFLEDVRRTFAGDLETLNAILTYTAGLACAETLNGGN